MNCKLAELKTMLTFVLDHGYNIPKDWRRRIASRQAQTDTGPVIRCSDCGGTVIWKKTTEGYEVIHGCGNGKQACAAIASAEARARQSVIDQVVHYQKRLYEVGGRESNAIQFVLNQIALYPEAAARTSDSTKEPE